MEAINKKFENFDRLVEAIRKHNKELDDLFFKEGKSIYGKQIFTCEDNYIAQELGWYCAETNTRFSINTQNIYSICHGDNDRANKILKDAIKTSEGKLKLAISLSNLR